MMKKKPEKNEVPAGYISIGQAAEILGIDPFDLRMLMSKDVDSNGKRQPGFNFRMASTPDRRLFVLESDIHAFMDRHAGWLSGKRGERG
jgi:hypothetical protein